MKNGKLNLDLTMAVAAGVTTASMVFVAVVGHGLLAGIGIAGAVISAGGCCYNGYRAWANKAPRSKDRHDPQ